MRLRVNARFCFVPRKGFECVGFGNWNDVLIGRWSEFRPAEAWVLYLLAVEERKGVQRIRSNLALEMVDLLWEKCVCCGLEVELQEASWRCSLCCRSGISLGNR